MKIVANDGREFDSVQACEVYENNLEKSTKENVMKEVADFISDKLSIVKVRHYTRNKSTDSYLALIHDKSEKERKTLLYALVERNYGSRYIIESDGLSAFQKYSFEKMTQQELEEIKGRIVRFLTSYDMNLHERRVTLNNVSVYNMLKSEIHAIVKPAADSYEACKCNSNAKCEENSASTNKNIKASSCDESESELSPFEIMNMLMYLFS